jgi:hypothetical protein
MLETRPGIRIGCHPLLTGVKAQQRNADQLLMPNANLRTRLEPNFFIAPSDPRLSRISEEQLISLGQSKAQRLHQNLLPMPNPNKQKRF